MTRISKIACALALSASALASTQSPAEAGWYRYWARPYYYTYAPTYYYVAPPAYYYAPPAYDASGAIVAGLALGLMGAAIASAASQPAYYWHGCNWYACW